MLTILVATAVTLAGSAATPMPGTPAFITPDVPWPIGAGLIDFGLKTTSDAYTDGHFSLTAPVFSSIGSNGTLGGSIAFVEPYISWGEQGEIATSLGLGFRHLFNEQPLSALQKRHTGWLDEGVMVGGNLFLDMLDTTSNNRFWQLGLGVEFSTRYLELRGNYYHPLNGRREGEPYVDRSIQRGTLITDGKEPFAQGHTIQQDVTFTTFDFYTDRVYRYYEEGMKGWDVEAAVLVPGLDKWCELWLVGGYGDFRNKPFGPQIGGTGEMHGWKAGVEFRPVPQVVMSATWYEDKRFQGGDWMYGLSFPIPLDPEPENKGKSWWRKVKDSLRPRSRHLAERTIVPVHRQNAAVKIANSIGVPEVQHSANALSSEEKRVVVRDDVIFVNNGGAQGNGIHAHGAFENGTAEQPFDTLKEGVNLASVTGYQAKGVPTVYVAGGGSSYSAEGVFFDGVGSDLNMPSGVHLVSGGLGVPAFASQFFGHGVPAIVSGGEDGIQFGGATGASVSRVITVDGFEFRDSPVNVQAEQVAFRNNIARNGAGIAAFDAEVTGNTVYGALGLASSLFAGTTTRATGPTSAVVVGNKVIGDGTSDTAVQGFTTVLFANNDVVWIVPPIGGVPGAPMAAIQFSDCRIVSLGDNRVTMNGSRSDIPGLAVFQFGQPFAPTYTSMIDLGGNVAVRGSHSLNVFALYLVGNVSGSFSINDVSLRDGAISITPLFLPLW